MLLKCMDVHICRVMVCCDQQVLFLELKMIILVLKLKQIPHNTLSYLNHKRLKKKMKNYRKNKKVLS